MSDNKKKTNVKPEPIYETKSDNQSAVKLVNKLRKNGIENNNFFMITKNPLVSGKDPYGQRLEFSDVRNISNECEENPWFYLRECLQLREDAGSEDLDHYPLTERAVAAFWLVDRGYSILLDMNHNSILQIAHAILLYYHQCGKRRHFEVISPDDDAQYDQTEYSAYNLTAPGYIFSQNNYEPIYYETQEVLMPEILYKKSAALTFIDDITHTEDIDHALDKWKAASRKPVLILGFDKKYGGSSDNFVDIDWEDRFYDDCTDLPTKKNVIVRIK